MGLFYNDNIHGPRNPHGATVHTTHHVSFQAHFCTYLFAHAQLNNSDSLLHTQLTGTVCADLRQKVVPLNNLIEHFMHLNSGLQVTFQHLHIVHRQKHQLFNTSCNTILFITITLGLLFNQPSSLQLIQVRSCTTAEPLQIAEVEFSRVGFLPAETCFCQTSGLNRQKVVKTESHYDRMV